MEESGTRLTRDNFTFSSKLLVGVFLQLKDQQHPDQQHPDDAHDTDKLKNVNITHIFHSNSNS
jgi:hypothetical protein